MSCTVTTSGWSVTGGIARLGACTTSASMRRWVAAAGARARSAALPCGRPRSIHGNPARDAPRTGAGRERDRARRRSREAGGAARSRSGRCRRGPAAAAARRGTRPSRECVRDSPVARRQTRGPCRPTRTRGRGRARARRARRAVVSSVRTPVHRVGDRRARWSARRAARRRPRPRGWIRRAPRRPARPRSSPRAPGSRSPRRSTGTRAASRAPSSARVPASVTRPASITRRARRPARRGDRGVDLGSGGTVVARRSRAGRRDDAPASSPNAPTRCAKFFRGSSVPIASTNGAPPSAASTLGRHLARRRRAAGRRAGSRRDGPAAQAAPEDLLDLVGDELRSPCAASRRARPRAGSMGSNARTSGVHSSGYRTNEQS